MDIAEQSLCQALRHNPEKGYIETLLNRGYQLNSCQEHRTALICLLNREPGVVLKADVISLLLEKGVNPHVSGTDSIWPFEHALRFGAYEHKAIKVMLDYLDLHPRQFVGEWKYNALFDALSNPQCREDTFKMLCRRGGKVAHRDSNNSTALHLIVHKPFCSYRLVRKLSKKNNYKNDVNRSHRSPLMSALKSISDPHMATAMFVAGCRLQKTVRPYLYNIVESYVVNFDLPKIQTPNFIRYLKQLVKFALLEKPSLDLNAFPRNLVNPALLDYAESCKRELVNIVEINLTLNCSLYQFVVPNRDNEENPIINHHIKALGLVQFMEALSGQHFPIYWDVIAANLSRKMFKDALEQTCVYLSIYNPNEPYMDEKVVLNYECVLGLIEVMHNVDILNLILAFRPTLLRQTGN